MTKGWTHHLNFEGSIRAEHTKAVNRSWRKCASCNNAALYFRCQELMLCSCCEREALPAQMFLKSLLRLSDLEATRTRFRFGLEGLKCATGTDAAAPQASWWSTIIWYSWMAQCPKSDATQACRHRCTHSNTARRLIGELLLCPLLCIQVHSQ